MKKLVLIAMVLLTAFVNCKKDPLSPSQITVKKMIGTWSLTSRGDIYPVGSQEITTPIINSYYEILEDGSINIEANGFKFAYHWELIDANTFKVINTGQIYKIATLNDTNLKFLNESINGNGVAGVTYFYFTKNVKP